MKLLALIFLVSVLSFNTDIDTNKLLNNPIVSNDGNIIASGETIVSETTTIPIASGPMHTLIIKENGDVYCLGYCQYHSLLIESQELGIVNSSIPIKVFENAVSVQTSQYHTFIVEKNGDLWSFGGSEAGDDGRGGIDNEYGVILTDTAVSFYRHALKKDGTLWGWGNYAFGKLAGGLGYGNGDKLPYEQYVDTPVIIIDNVVSASWLHALRNDGTLWTWEKQQIGEEERVEDYWPRQIADNVSEVMEGAYIKSDKTLWLLKAYGQLEELLGEVFPIRVADDVKFAANNGESVAFIKTDGSLWVFGDNENGLFGDKLVNFYSEPVKIMDDVTFFSFGGLYHSYALKSNGELYQIGYDRYVDGIRDGSASSNPEDYKPHKIMDGVMQPQIVTLELD